MDNERYINLSNERFIYNERYINHSNERFISLNIIEELNFIILSDIHIYDEQIINTPMVPGLSPMVPGISPLATWSSLPPLTHDEIVLPAFIEQEVVIPDDAVCGITFEKPDCRTPCGHHFCRAEITKWLKQQKKEHDKMTCPSCRAGITSVIPDNTKRELNLEDVD